MHHLPLGLEELHLVRPRVDRCEEIAFLHDLSFPEMDLHELAVDPALYRDRIEGGHRSETADVKLHIAFFSGRRSHGNGARRGGRLGGSLWRPCLRLA